MVNNIQSQISVGGFMITFVLMLIHDCTTKLLCLIRSMISVPCRPLSHRNGGKRRCRRHGIPPISLADVTAPAWLDHTMMIYRLTYANDLQPRPYVNMRWIMPPRQLFSQRLKARISQAGGNIVALSDGAANFPVLPIDIDNFSQNFDSFAQVAIRASLFTGRVS
ncbi:MAG: membrane integrity-associated transporter subunit PqiC [Glaciimonas sp.]|nr:membrane integrity-associated transporter subunit PqiC [Glaciimonas sp.]